MENKSGQVTIFVIIAILLVVAVMAFFLLRGNVLPEIGGKAEEDPNKFFASCIEGGIEEARQLMLSHGGYVEPELHVVYDNKTIAYLCYNKNYYQTCINQEPVYIEHLEREIENYISDDVRDCFDDLAVNFEKKGYVVDAKYNGFEVGVVPSKIVIDVVGSMSLTKSGATSKQIGFKIVKPSALFEIANVAREIVNQEAKYCSFEYVGYMLFYSRYDIDKKAIGQGPTASKIYIIGDRKTNEKLNIAVRGCEVPPGI